MRESLLHGAGPLTLAVVLVACSLPVGAPAFAGEAKADPLLARVQGTGSPTVILAGGLGDTLEIWNEVQPAIAANCARTFAYNRAGYVGSLPASGPRDAETIVAELRSELARRSIRPPYVLVGHSLGGLYMQYFARRYPDEVSGLLLVDSTHWNQQLPTDAPAASPYGRRLVLLYMSLITRRELADSARAGEQVHESPRAGDVPTIVLSSTGARRGETPDARVTGARLQEDIAADFPAARHMRVSGSSHYIHRDRPEIVINSARALAGCGPLLLAARAPASPS